MATGALYLDLLKRSLAMCRKAVEDFFATRKEAVPTLTQVDWTSVFFVK